MLKQNILYINIYKQQPLSQRLFVNNYFCKKNSKTNQGFRIHKKRYRRTEKIIKTSLQDRSGYFFH